MTGVFCSLWRWRRLVGEFAAREFRSRYAGSALGLAWAVLEPLVQIALYLIVFGLFFGMRLERDPGVGAFALYVIAGLVPFLILQESVVRASGLARERAALVRHIGVPLEVPLAGMILAVLARQGVMLALATVAAALSGTMVWARLPFLALGVLILCLGTFGLCLFLLPAGAFLPDLVQVVGLGTMVLLYLSPIVYPLTAVPARFAGLVGSNPLVGLLELFRTALLGGPLSAGRVALSGVFSILVLAGGLAFYSRRAWAVRDVV